MPHTSRSETGRHRAPAAEAPLAPAFRERGRHVGKASEAVGPIRKGPDSDPAPAPKRSGERLRRRTTTVTIATFGLISGFLFAAPANAEEPDYLAPSGAAASAQSLTISGDAQNQAANRDSFKAFTPSEGATIAAASTPKSTNYDWARLVLIDGGWPTSDTNIAVITQWMASENGPDDWYNRNNPLNNGYGSGGGSGLGSYDSLTIAAQKAAENLHQGSGYAAIVNGLAASAPISEITAAIWASPWAGSHYEYGGIWNGKPGDPVSAPAEDW